MRGVFVRFLVRSGRVHVPVKVGDGVGRHLPWYGVRSAVASTLVVVGRPCGLGETCEGSGAGGLRTGLR